MSQATYTITPLWLGLMTHYERSAHLYACDQGVKMQSPYIAFLIRGNGKNIVVDTGPCSPELVAKYHGHVRVDIKPEDSLPSRLKEQGVAPADVDYVINTHLHWDHCYNNNLFPGKPIYVQKAEIIGAMFPYECHWFTYESPQSGLTPPWFENAHQFKVVDGDAEIDDGIGLYLTPGHTKGSQCVMVNTGDGPYLICGDTINIYDNWTGNGKLKHIATGIHIDLSDCYASFEKIETLRFTALIPGHDIRVFDNKVYPAPKA